MKCTKRRNNLDVDADIIRVAQTRGGALKTQIVYGANLNFKIVKRYLSELIQSGLIKPTGSRYYPTERAMAFLEAYENLVSFGEVGAGPLVTRVTDGLREVG